MVQAEGGVQSDGDPHPVTHPGHLPHLGDKYSNMCASVNKKEIKPCKARRLLAFSIWQCCGSRFIESGSIISSESGSGYGSRVLMTKIWKNNSWYFFYIFFDKNWNLLIPRQSSYRRSLQPSKVKRKHPALQKNEMYKLFSIFVGNFFPPGLKTLLTGINRCRRIHTQQTLVY